MEFAEVIKKNTENLDKDLKEKRIKLRELKFILASGKAKSMKEFKEIKKDIARILTAINQKKS